MEKTMEIHDRICHSTAAFTYCALDEEDLNLGDGDIIELVCDILDNDGPR